MKGLLESLLLVYGYFQMKAQSVLVLERVFLSVEFVESNDTST